MFFPYQRIWVIIHISLEVSCMAMPLGSQHRTGTCMTMLTLGNGETIWFVCSSTFS